MATPARILSQFGGQTFFRGLVTSCGREGLFTAGYLGIAPVIQRTLTEQYSFSEGACRPCVTAHRALAAPKACRSLVSSEYCRRRRRTWPAGLAKPCAAIGAGVIAATGSHPMDSEFGPPFTFGRSPWSSPPNNVTNHLATNV